MATTIAIDDEADEELSSLVIETKKRSRQANKPTDDITKFNVASAILKQARRNPYISAIVRDAFGVPPARNPKRTEPRP